MNMYLICLCDACERDVNEAVTGMVRWRDCSNVCVSLFACVRASVRQRDRRAWSAGTIAPVCCVFVRVLVLVCEREGGSEGVRESEIIVKEAVAGVGPIVRLP